MKQMKKQGKRILAAALCAGVFAGTMPVSVLADAVVRESVAGWLTASPQTVQPFAAQTDALEENGGLTYAANAVVSTIDPFGTVYEMRAGWNNTGSYHASINNAQQLFGKTGFTLLLDVKTENGSSGDALTRSAALNIGNSANALRIGTYDGVLRWGAYPSGVSANSTDLTVFDQGEWNAIALVYEEKDGGNGSVAVYVNGQLSAQVEDVGFQLSSMTGIQAMLGRSLNTSYLNNGLYDNIVYSDTAMTEEEAKEATASRKQAKTSADFTILENTIQSVESQLAADLAAGVNYAETPLEISQVTGSGSTIPKDSLQDLNEALEAAKALLQDESATNQQAQDAAAELQSIYDGLRVLPDPYTSIPGTDGDVIYADTGLPMQAHGGSAMALQEGTGDGSVNYDLDGDGEITQGKTVYLWYGEDKTNNTRPVDGVRCYVSTDLYNWTDRGTVLYLQNTILPIEESDEKAVTSSVGADGEGTTQSYNAMQLSQTNYETLKAWGKLETAPEGVAQEDFDEVKRFLRAYVIEFEKAPVSADDTTWTAKSYDETPFEASSLLYPDSQTRGTQITSPLQMAFEGLYGDYCITERPKMIYNETTGKFVIVFHADGPLYNNQVLNEWVAGGCEGTMSASRYSRAMVGFAESDTPFGPFKLVNMTRMNYDTSYHADRLGEARDMTVFVDKGVDSNNDGVDDAYVIYSSEMNARLYVSLLDENYTDTATENSDGQGTTWAGRIVSETSREAPAVFKYDGWYYMITSGTDGWNSTAHTYYRSQSLLSGWEAMGNPAQNDTGKCFNTQVTYVLPIDAEAGKFIYMGDRWNGNNLTDSRTVWLPLQVNPDEHTIAILGESDWTLDRLDALTPTKVLTEIPETVYTDGSNLPDTLEVIWNGSRISTAVEWTIDNLGNTTIAATLLDCQNAVAELSAFVVPTNVVYFANMAPEPMSADYETIMAENADTVLNTVNDGAYSAQTGFGYTGASGSLRGNTTDIYQSLRYAANKTDSIAYRFDLEPGEYEVYIGMFDPSGWATWNTGRAADILLNGTTVTTGYSYYQNCNDTPDTLHYTDVQVGEDGVLTVEVAPNASTDSAVQVSFIVVSKAEQEVQPTATPVPTAEPTATPVPTAEPTATPVPTAEPTATPVPTAEPTATPAPTAEPTATPVPTAEPTATPVPTAEPTATPVPTAEPTASPVPTAEPTATPAPTEKPTASVIENETVTEGAQLPIVVKVEAAFDSFLRVLLNGNELDAANYELKEGSIIITLKPAFVETLEVGRYTLCVQTENGDAEVTFEVKAKTPNPDATVTPAPTTAPTQPDTGDSSTLPATGDTSAAALLAVLMTASAAMAVAIKRRRHS